MKKPGLSLAAIVLLFASTNLSAAMISPVLTESSLSATKNFSILDGNMFSFNDNYLNSITSTEKSITSSVGQQEETSIPVPAAAWLFISGLLGMIGISRRRRKH